MVGLGFSLRVRVKVRVRVKGWSNIYEFTASKEAFPIYYCPVMMQKELGRYHYD